MKLLRLPRLTTLVGVAALLALLSPGSITVAGPGGGVRVLYPPAGAIVTASPVLIMIVSPDAPKAPAFRLDGSPLRFAKMTFAEAWKDVPGKIPMPAGSDDLPLRSTLLGDKTGNVLWVATTDLAVGEHSVSLDDTTLATFASRGPREADARTWEEPVLRVHGSPGTRAEVLDCGQCHQSESSKVLGAAPLPEACHTCHDDVDLSLSHEHVMEFLAKCQMCHDPHAATRPSLLIDRREVVCAQCHESGYAR